MRRVISLQVRMHVALLPMFCSAPVDEIVAEVGAPRLEPHTLDGLAQDPRY